MKELKMSPSKKNPLYINRSNQLENDHVLITLAEKSWANAGGLVLYSYDYILTDLTIFTGKRTNKRYQLLRNNINQTFVKTFRSIKEARLYMVQNS